MYLQIYDLIMTYIYGGVEVITSDMELVATLISTFGCLALVALPFVMVYWFTKLFF